MNNKFFSFLKNIEGASFIKPSDEELLKFREISCGKLPDMFTEVYTNAVPADESEITYYKEKIMHRLDFNYHNIIKVSYRLADSLTEFIDELSEETGIISTP